jgi:Ca2+:H+ antiporter
MGRALGVLAVATVGIAWMSEMLVGAVEPAAYALGMNSVFVGIFVVAIFGNAAEHATAITAAVGNRMDLTLGIAVESSAQIALFVTPVLVLASLGCGPQPMDLVCFPGLVLTVFFAVLVLGQVSDDGESNWIKGVQLLAVYLILAIVFYFAPGRTP